MKTRLERTSWRVWAAACGFALAPRASARKAASGGRRGITLIEVLVTIFLSLLVVGLAVMLLVRHRENALRVQCMNNLKRQGEAFHAYEQVEKDLPPSRIAEGYATWAVLLAPHLVKENPLLQWNKQDTYFAQPDEVRQARLIVYFCPSRQRTTTLSEAGDVDAVNKHYPGALGDYAAVAGNGSAAPDWTGPKANGALVIAEVVQRKDNRIVQWKSRTSLALIDRQRGKSYTFLVGEKHVPLDHAADAGFGDGSLYNGQNPANFARIAGQGFPLADGPASPFNNNFGSYHRGICHFLFADNSVRPLANDTSEMVLDEYARHGD